MVTRRKFLSALGAAGAVYGAGFSSSSTSNAAQQGGGAIDRAALVRRHNPSLRKIDTLAPLSVGNGEFAFTGDVTGLQTFPAEYEERMPLCTMSQWGWHTTPRPRELEGARLRLNEYDTHGRKVGYHTSSEGQKELFDWLRENPHRLHLGRVALRLTKRDGAEARAEDIKDIEQTLDLWSGVITSRFKFDGRPVTVRTAVHPRLDLLAVSVESPLIQDGRLAARFAFPYGSPKMHAADWEQPARHQSKLSEPPHNRAEIRRTLDADSYIVTFAWDGAVSFSTEKEHHFLLTPDARAARLSFVAHFAPRPLRGQALPTAGVTFEAAAAHWQRFWTTGGAVELAGSRDPRAHELERRIVLSQYLTAIQCSGSQPPQETGLTTNSWYGKFHLEMHWWHAAHFPLWRRLPLFEQSLGWYEKILPGAQALARSQGYAGARWPKMVGPDGRDSPSPIGPLLIWQQPHPIFYAELCYLAGGRTRRALGRYSRIVFETAEFMASFAHLDTRSGRYVLGPPVIPAQENHPARETWNPTFELAYWRFGLKTAQAWRERLGLRRVPKWDDVVSRLSPLPVKDGVYLAHENCPQTYTERNRDHPSMLGALGILDDSHGADRETMRRTLKKVMKEWQWDETWGWDYPMTAMTAARLGETEIAVDALLLKTAKNSYAANGHNYQRPNLPLYLPGNGGLLYAVALMAAGWRGAPPTHAPGFPTRDWTVRWEGLDAALLRQL